jgi:hypothetical protein
MFDYLSLPVMRLLLWGKPMVAFMATIIMGAAVSADIRGTLKSRVFWMEQPKY